MPKLSTRKFSVWKKKKKKKKEEEEEEEEVQFCASGRSLARRFLSSVVCPMSVIAKLSNGRLLPEIASKRHGNKNSLIQVAVSFCAV
jgi:hypothetical protein